MAALLPFSIWAADGSGDVSKTGQGTMAEVARIDRQDGNLHFRQGRHDFRHVSGGCGDLLIGLFVLIECFCYGIHDKKAGRTCPA